MSLLRKARERLSPLPERFDLDRPTPGGFKRLYHVHIRKCGGTSINRMVLSALSEDLDADWDQLHRHWRHRIIVGGRPVVGWHRRLIERGAFFYAFSHIPFHALTLPPKTYTFALLRDPADRVISHYRMLLGLQRSASGHVDLRAEGHWLGASFMDFLNRIPREHLCRQLYTFSARLDVAEAVETARRITDLRLLSEIDSLASEVSQEFGLSILPRWDQYHASAADFTPSPVERAALDDSLADETRFLQQLACASLIRAAPQ